MGGEAVIAKSWNWSVMVVLWIRLVLVPVTVSV